MHLVKDVERRAEFARQFHRVAPADFKMTARVDAHSEGKKVHGE